MANNNNLLFNAALNGFVAGAVEGRNLKDATAADYSTLVQQAKTFATEVDAAIPNDAGISGAGGVTLPPTTAAIADAQTSQTVLLYGICKSVRSGQFQAPATPVPATGFATISAAAAALYNETKAQQAAG